MKLSPSLREPISSGVTRKSGNYVSDVLDFTVDTYCGQTQAIIEQLNSVAAKQKALLPQICENIKKVDNAMSLLVQLSNLLDEIDKDFQKLKTLREENNDLNEKNKNFVKDKEELVIVLDVLGLSETQENKACLYELDLEICATQQKILTNKQCFIRTHQQIKNSISKLFGRKTVLPVTYTDFVQTRSKAANGIGALIKTREKLWQNFMTLGGLSGSNST